MRSAAGNDVLKPVGGPQYPAYPRAYGTCVVVLLMALIGGLAFLGVHEGAQPLALITVFAALVVASENRDRLFGDETSISGSIAVAIASIFAFRGSAPLFGPVACATCAGLYWPHLRYRDLSKVIINSASIGLSALAGAVVLRVTSPAGELSLGKTLLLSLPVVLVYWIVNSVVLSVASLLLRGDDFVPTAKLLLRSETKMIGFATGGALCGFLVLQHGLWLGTVSTVLLLVTIDVFVISGPRRSVFVRPSRTALLARFSSCFAVGLAALLCASSVPAAIVLVAGATSGVLFSCAIAFVALRRRLGAWDLRVAVGVAIADAPLVVLFAAGGLLAAQVDVAVAVVSVTAVLAIGTLASRWLDRRRDVQAEHDEDALMTAIEIALLDSYDVPASSR
jgi:hypothetical protein